jgi:hypothetical protein
MQSESDQFLSDLRVNSYSIKRVNETLMNDVLFLEKAAGIDGMLLVHFDKEYRANRKIVIAAVRQNGEALKHADASLRNDKEIVKIAVETDCNAIKFASFETTCDPDIYQVALKKRGGALDLLPNRLKRDKDVVRMAVERDGLALQYADHTLRQDKDIVLSAVQQKGFALKHAGDKLRHDTDVVLAAVQQNGHVLKDVEEPLKSMKNIVIEAVRSNGLALKHSSEKGTADGDVVLEAVIQNGDALKYAHPSLKEDRAIVLAAVKQHGLAIEHADPSLRGDVDVALAAVEQEGTSILYLHETLLRNSDFLLQAVKRDGMALCITSGYSEVKFVYPRIEYSDWFTINEIIRDFLIDLYRINPDYNEMLVRAALENNGYALRFAGIDFGRDWEMVLLATRQTWRALALADEVYWEDKNCLKAAISQLPKNDMRRERLAEYDCVFRLPSQKTTKILRDGVWGMTVEEIETKLTQESREFLTVRIVDEGSNIPMKKYMIPYPPLELCQKLHSHGVNVRFPVPSVWIGQGAQRDIYECSFSNMPAGHR